MPALLLERDRPGTLKGNHSVYAKALRRPAGAAMREVLSTKFKAAF